jgi:hypothetical protein
MGFSFSYYMVAERPLELKMRVQRLQIDMEFECNDLSVYHSLYENLVEPTTTVVINGEEFEGKVALELKEDEWIIHVFRGQRL